MSNVKIESTENELTTTEKRNLVREWMKSALNRWNDESGFFLTVIEDGGGLGKDSSAMGGKDNSHMFWGELEVRPKTCSKFSEPCFHKLRLNMFFVDGEGVSEGAQLAVFMDKGGKPVKGARKLRGKNAVLLEERYLSGKIGTGGELVDEISAFIENNGCFREPTTIISVLEEDKNVNNVDWSSKNIHPERSILGNTFKVLEKDSNWPTMN